MPLDLEDLPGFASQLVDIYARHPELVRLISWQRLERGDDPPNAHGVQDLKDRIRAIADAQTAGLISSRFEAPVLFALVLQIAALWGTTSPDILAVVRVSSTKQRREIIKRAVEALLA